MTIWHRCFLAALAMAITTTAAVAQCGFAVQPVADRTWIRSEGWTVPGLQDAKGFANIPREINGKPTPYVFPEGITVQWVQHMQSFVVEFPGGLLEENGVQKKMLPRRFALFGMWRWQMNGNTYAYSYLLLPYDVACTASVDIIDDRGDGKFRLMTSPGHTLMLPPGTAPTPPPIPEWLQRPKS